MLDDLDSKEIDMLDVLDNNISRASEEEEEDILDDLIYLTLPRITLR